MCKNMLLARGSSCCVLDFAPIGNKLFHLVGTCREVQLVMYRVHLVNDHSVSTARRINILPNNDPREI